MPNRPTMMVRSQLVGRSGLRRTKSSMNRKTAPPNTRLAAKVAEFSYRRADFITTQL